MFELNVRFVPVLGGKLPVVPVTNTTLHVVSSDSSARVIFVALVEVPVTSPVTSPVRSPVTLPVKLPANPPLAVAIPVANMLPVELRVIPDQTITLLPENVVAVTSPVNTASPPTWKCSFPLIMSVPTPI